MAVKASATITLSFMVDVSAVYRYYKLQASTASAPSAPTSFPPSGWTDTEPNYTSGSTQTLYTVDCTVFANDTFLYSAVSKSSSYEAAKEAYNKALAAEGAATEAKDAVDHLEVGGRNLLGDTAGKFFEKYYSGYVDSETYRGFKVLTCDNTAASSGSIDFAYHSSEPEYHLGNVEPNQEYTMSFYAKGIYTSSAQYPEFDVHFYNPNEVVRVTSSFGFNGVSVDGACYVPITESWQRVSVTWTVSSTASGTKDIIFLRCWSGTRVSICGLKLEKGNRATDWTPAPEDIEADVEEAAGTATKYLTYVDGALMVSDMADPNRQFLANATWQSLDTLTWEDLDGYTWSDADIGKNVLIDSDGVKIRNNTTNLALFGANAIEFDKAATFKADGVLVDNGDAFAYLGRNTVLWTGGASGYWMNASQSITLSTNITRQISGAVFAWSLYQSGAAVDSDWHFIFVPKYQVANFGGNVIRMHDAYLGMNKILYVSNGNVSGHAQNGTSGTTNGIAWDNSKWVLRYIVGV